MAQRRSLRSIIALIAFSLFCVCAVSAHQTEIAICFREDENCYSRNAKCRERHYQILTDSEIIVNLPRQYFLIVEV